MIHLMFYDECNCEVRTAAGIEAAPRRVRLAPEEYSG
jgi:hypothetical protein